MYDLLVAFLILTSSQLFVMIFVCQVNKYCKYRRRTWEERIQDQLEDQLRTALTQSCF